MATRIISKADYESVPWKNGGGMATNIFAAPAGSTLADFNWRLSLAHVASDGAFSIFKGIDRTILILNGQGLQLHGLGDGPGDMPVTLGAASQPFSFAGDVPVRATLAAGPIDDLNLMTRRGHFAHSLARNVLMAGAPHTLRPGLGGTMLIFAERGSATASVLKGVGSYHLAQGDTLVADGDVALTPTPELTMVCMAIWPVMPD